MLKRISFWVKSVLHGVAAVRLSRKQRALTAWESMVHAASEELLDDHDLGVTISLPFDTPLDVIVDYILREARHKPNLDAMIRHLSNQYGLSAEDGIRAIDRTLGGIVRAAHQRATLCPDPVRDPIAFESFKRTAADYSLVQDIYQGYSLPDAERNNVRVRPNR